MIGGWWWLGCVYWGGVESLLIVFSHLTAFLRYSGTSLQFVSSAAAEVQQQGSGGGNSATHPLPPGAKILHEQPNLKSSKVVRAAAAASFRGTTLLFFEPPTPNPTQPPTPHLSTSPLLSANDLFSIQTASAFTSHSAASKLPEVQVFLSCVLYLFFFLNIFPHSSPSPQMIDGN